MNSRVKVYNAVTQQWSSCLQIIEHNGTVYSMARSADGAHIGSTVDKLIHIWDAFTGTKVQILQGHSHQVQSVAFSLDGKHLVSGSNDKTVRIWEVVTGTELHTLQGHSGDVKSVGFSSDGRHVVSGSADNTVTSTLCNRSFDQSTPDFWRPESKSVRLSVERK
jgi:WD40 repeat protein